MNSTKTKPSSGKLAAVTVIAVMLVVGACASGNILKWNQVDSAAMMKSDAGMQKLNTVRFETFGPDAEQLFGYFLYKDGIEVITGEGIPQKRLGKLTLREVMDDYARVVRERQFTSGSNLIVREVLRGDLVVGYTAHDINMDVNDLGHHDGQGCKSRPAAGVQGPEEEGRRRHAAEHASGGTVAPRSGSEKVRECGSAAVKK